MLAIQLDKLSSKKSVKRIMYVAALAFLICFILIPPILGITLNIGLVQHVFSDPMLIARAQSAIFWSFAIAIMVSSLDLLAGLPLAWLIARRRSRWINVLDSLADIPFIIPTVALGFSTLLFLSGSASMSGVPGLALLSPGLILIMLLHFAF